MKKLICAGLALLLSLGVFAGCEGHVSDEQEPIDETKTTLRVATFEGGVGDEWLQNAADRFENLLADTARARSVEEDATGNWRDLEQFFSRRPMIKAYFHGDKNYCEFYTWTGVDGSIRLPVFRVDSPMKGEFSAGDEALLSFLVATVDMEARRLTVRECLWNTEGRTAVRWGSVCAISY